MRHNLLAGAVVGLLLIPSVSGARPSFNAQNYKQATDSGYYLGVYGSQPLPQGKFTLGLAVDWAEEPVILVNAAGAKLQDVIHREIATQVYGSYGILPWFDAGVLVTLVPYLKFQGVGLVTNQTQFKMGDTQVNFRFRILDSESFPLGLAVVPFVSIPTGAGESFAGNEVFTGGGIMVLDSPRVSDRFSASLNAGVEVRERTALTSGTTVDDFFRYGAALNFSVHPTVDLIAELRGFTLLNDFFNESQRPLEIGGGIRFYPNKHLAGTVGGAVGVMEGVGHPVYRVLASFAYIPEHQGYERIKEIVTDTDGDGIRDNKDRCPTEAGPKSNQGCPEERKVEIRPEDYRIAARPIHFDFALATLRPDALPILQAVTDVLKAKPTIRRLSIEGHCDFIGTDEFNDWLSLERAKAVQDYLVEHGVEPERLQIVGHGERVPIDPADTDEAREKNRRVEFVFKEVKGVTLPETVPASKTPTLPETNISPEN